MRHALAALAVCLAALPAPAQVPDEIGPDRWGGAAALLAGAERVVPLETRPVRPEIAGATAEGRLRLSLLVLDLGPPVGLRPRQALHFAAFNEVEAVGVAWALVPVAEVWEFAGAAELQPGVFEIDADAIPGPDLPECEIERAVIRLDARALIARVEAAAGLAPGEAVRLRAPVEIVRRSVQCQRP